MLITLSNKHNDETQQWIFDFDDVLSSEAELIEKNANGEWDSYEQWMQKFKTNNPRAERVGLWIVRRRTEPGLSLDDVDPPFRHILVRYTEAELEDMRRRIRDNPDLSDDVREKLYEKFGRPTEDGDPGPLEPSEQPSEQATTPPSEPAGDGPSPTT